MRMQLALLAAACALVAPSSADHGRTAAFVAGPGAPRGTALTREALTLTPRRHLALGSGPSPRAGRAAARLAMSTDVQDDKRLLGSRRLAAATDVIKSGAASDEEVGVLARSFSSARALPRPAGHRRRTPHGPGARVCARAHATSPLMRRLPLLAPSASSAEQAARIAPVTAGHQDHLHDAARPKAHAGLQAPERGPSNTLQQSGPGPALRERVAAAWLRHGCLKHLHSVPAVERHRGISRRALACVRLPAPRAGEASASLCI